MTGMIFAGVTFIGAKEQIAKQLIARGDISREHVFHGSAYIARTVSTVIFLRPS
jgi:DNA-directed RNA polymerase, mitochondrial